MKVRCYWNLHQGLWSIQDAKTRRVIGHAFQVMLRDGEFTVSQAGRERVLKERKKNVHAFACGNLVAAIWSHTSDAFTALAYHWEGSEEAERLRRQANKVGRVVTYNPYNVGYFYEKETGERVDTSPVVYLTWENGRDGFTPKSRVLAFDPAELTLKSAA